MTFTDEERAQKNRDAQRKYNATHDKTNVRLEGGSVDRMKALGYTSANSFIVQAVREKLEREESATKKSK